MVQFLQDCHLRLHKVQLWSVLPLLAHHESLVHLLLVDDLHCIYLLSLSVLTEVDLSKISSIIYFRIDYLLSDVSESEVLVDLLLSSFFLLRTDRSSCHTNSSL